MMRFKHVEKTGLTLEFLPHDNTVLRVEGTGNKVVHTVYWLQVILCISYFYSVLYLIWSLPLFAIPIIL